MQKTIMDGDRHFEIDPVSRLIKPLSDKISIAQFDHNSERVTFSIPRFVEGHDMTECTNVEVHYSNIDAVSKAESVGVYQMTDIQTDPKDEERAICTWLISRNATQRVGLLRFSIRFTCVDKDASVLYSWNTGVFSSMIVLESLYNSEDVVERYADVLEQWKNIFEETIGTIAPYVGQGGNWYVYDKNTGKFTDTGVRAQPQRGIDFWTEADQETIMNDIKNGIGTGVVTKFLKLGYPEKESNIYATITVTNNGELNIIPINKEGNPDLINRNLLVNGKKVLTEDDKVGLASEAYVDEKTEGLASEAYVDEKTEGLASEEYVEQEITGLSDELKEGVVTKFFRLNYPNNNNIYTTMTLTTNGDLHIRPTNNSEYKNLVINHKKVLTEDDAEELKNYIDETILGGAW